MIRTRATIVLAMIFAFTAPAAFAQDATLTLDEPVAINNCSFGMSVLVSSPSNIDFFQFVINYNSTCVAFDSVKLGSAATSFTIMRVNDDANTGPFPISPTPTTFDRHVLVQGLNTTGSFTGNLQHAVTLYFTSVGPTGTCNYEWDGTLVNGQYRSFLGRTNGNDIVNSPPGTIAFVANTSTGEGSRIIGNAHYYDVDTNYIANVQMKAVQGTTVFGPIPTDTNGDYEITGLANGSTKVVATRITDNDHKISIGGHDAILMFRMAAGSLTPTQDQLRAADINRSGAPVDITDADLVSRWLAFFPAPGVATWTFDLSHEGTVAQDSIVFSMDCADDTVNAKGFFRGDVDSTWALRTPKAERPISVAMSMATQRWEGDIVTVEMRGEQAGDFESMLYSLEYDVTAFEYLGAVKGSQAAGALLVDNGTEPGRIHGALLGVQENIGASGSILELRWRARTAAATSRLAFTRLRIDDRPAADAPEMLLSRGSVTTDALPKRFALSSAPNPFNPSTRITYSIPGTTGTVAVSVRIYDIAGRLVRDLVDGQRVPGQYAVTWDGRDANGEGASTGIYLVRMRAGDWSEVEKVSLLK